MSPVNSAVNQQRSGITASLDGSVDSLGETIRITSNPYAVAVTWNTRIVTNIAGSSFTTKNSVMDKRFSIGGTSYR